MFMRYELNIEVHRCDRITLEQAESLEPDYILVSPGPKDPSQAGISVWIVKHFYDKVPILGVCLGMQCINEAFGGKTIRAQLPMHGKTSVIQHNGKGIFKDIPTPFRAARYHSLVVELNNKALNITSRSQGGVIMGLSHPKYPLNGVQFHPESFLTEHGFLLIENFLRIGRLKI
jgi:anthranilate synthase component 2